MVEWVCGVLYGFEIFLAWDFHRARDQVVLIRSVELYVLLTFDQLRRVFPLDVRFFAIRLAHELMLLDNLGLLPSEVASFLEIAHGDLRRLVEPKLDLFKVQTLISNKLLRLEDPEFAVFQIIYILKIIFVPSKILKFRLKRFQHEIRLQIFLVPPKFRFPLIIKVCNDLYVYNI